jgi:hypothetical protein
MNILFLILNFKKSEPKKVHRSEAQLTYKGGTNLTRPCLQKAVLSSSYIWLSNVLDLTSSEKVVIPIQPCGQV